MLAAGNAFGPFNWQIVQQTVVHRSVLASPSGTFGHLRRDSTLATTVAKLRDELSALQNTADSADGNVKRFKADSALSRSVADSRRAMSLLFDDIRRRPLHYVHF